MTLHCAVVVIGDELMTGAVADTNSSWIADRLLGLGARATLFLGVEDDLEAIQDAFQLAGARAEHVIVAGGLGPTEDDITRDAFRRFAGVGMVENQAALDKIKAIFQMIGRTMTDNNRKQAQLPEGSTLIPNPIGTAPGFYLAAHGATYYFLPGVPRELELMMVDTVLPLLRAQARGAAIRQVVYRTFGMTESQLDATLKELELPSGVRLGYRAVFPEIQLKLIAEAASEPEAIAKLEAPAAEVRRRVGQVIYSDDGRSLEEVVVHLLRERGRRLALAESCTGGLIAKRITDVPGASEVFDRGFVVYSNPAKQELLGVPAEVIQTYGAVSRETAIAMARGALERSRADLAVAVTGVAGPSGGTADKPVGTVHIAIADREAVVENQYLFARAERSWVRELTAQGVLELIRRKLLGLGDLVRK